MNFNETKNFQEAARIKRYQFFEKVIKNEQAQYLLTAHHAVDNLETILIRLIKSSSHKGYAGIEKLQKHNDYYIYRPLINLTKQDIYDYQKIGNLIKVENLKVMSYNDADNTSATTLYCKTADGKEFNIRMKDFITTIASLLILMMFVMQFAANQAVYTRIMSAEYAVRELYSPA